ncbi:formate dehydrogenase accessory sulfurtransferase FdhD [Dechloromonas denitrificans]|uniref:formate dehydrogenase accessory sulfurtransferase FdhD n=1 Tax=Dechloromonas denitrificans TaxID=281362 RepID=UPI001CF8CB34|nr:formate dehydrogenase accessory sulfurtransferase FdhD [Dechloromonas denitrificans]UCV05636.1 formate dehydrogenase accessory sulfurtransferase FdhD [Dechloromonas denitrificans]UCV05953.1 formate dehydrogenase accessory sulfurtransferase FdhD [Dechloromonas denitrificans]
MTSSTHDYQNVPSYDDVVLPPPSSVRNVLRVQRGCSSTAEDEIIEEVPIALVYNGISHAVMLASPTDLEDFALGFSLSEGILAHRRELYDLELRNGCDGISIEMDIAPARFMALKERRRSLAGRTGCGLCGVDSLAGVTRMPASPLASPTWRLSVEAIGEGLRQLPHWQTLRQQTGSAHGAAWVDRQGNIRCLREDVGRHNALDKLVGALAGQGEPAHDGFALVTSRASYEMVQKAASAGISTLVAVSAPTALAIRQAEAAGILLIGFARANQLVAYSCTERLGFDATENAGNQSIM